MDCPLRRPTLRAVLSAPHGAPPPPSAAPLEGVPATTGSPHVNRNLSRSLIMKFIHCAVAAALLSAASLSFAAKGEFGDLCATGLAMGKEVPTDCSINMQVDGKTYCFSGDKPKQMFMDDQANMLKKAQETYQKMTKN
jgi:YHS domain-containing protein